MNLTMPVFNQMIEEVGTLNGMGSKQSDGGAEELSMYLKRLNKR